VFRSDIKYVVFNPTWTIPRGILGRSTLPAIKKDPNYLANHNMKVVDSNGKNIEPSTIDWASMTRRNFPYSIVQQPGPHNALGLVKFIFPNSHSVFLHDTPHRELFGETARAFSSGCVRVENPFDLATLLLDDKPGFSRHEIDGLIESGRSKTEWLSKPLPVIIMYWTVEPNPDGTVTFLADVYDRDTKLLAALDKPFNPTRTRLRH
jgi:murein L,D-transpeptidase YcbB/YkuD